MPNSSNDNLSQSCKQASQNKSAEHRMEHYLCIFSLYRLYIYYLGMIFIYNIWTFICIFIHIDYTTY